MGWYSVPRLSFIAEHLLLLFRQMPIGSFSYFPIYYIVQVDAYRSTPGGAGTAPCCGAVSQCNNPALFTVKEQKAKTPRTALTGSLALLVASLDPFCRLSF